MEQRFLYSFDNVANPTRASVYPYNGPGNVLLCGYFCLNLKHSLKYYIVRFHNEQWHTLCLNSIHSRLNLDLKAYLETMLAEILTNLEAENCVNYKAPKTPTKCICVYGQSALITLLTQHKKGSHEFKMTIKESSI